MNGLLGVWWGPSGNVIVCLQTSVVVLSLLLSVSSNLSIDSRGVFRALFKPSLNSLLSAVLHEPPCLWATLLLCPRKAHTMGVWTEEDPSGRGDYHQVSSSRDNGGICWVLYLRPPLLFGPLRSTFWDEGRDDWRNRTVPDVGCFDHLSLRNKSFEPKAQHLE